MTSKSEVAIYIHDGRIVRVKIKDEAQRAEILEAFYNRMGSANSGGAVRLIHDDATYVFNVDHVAFVEAVN